MPGLDSIRAPVRRRPCHHHWRIESPNGATSRGRCLRCGAEREFRNWGVPARTLSAQEKTIVTRTKREDAAIRQIIFHMGSGEGALPLSAYRRNVRDGGE